MRVVFFGTPECAVPYLDVIRGGHELVAVVTQPDRRKGRGRKLTPPPVKLRALDLGVLVLQPEVAHDPEFLARLERQKPDVMVVVAYGQIMRRKLIELPPVASINVHYSLLPLLRGAAPVQHALLQGLTETGVTVQHIVRKLDAGDIILQQPVAILPQDDRETLMARLTVAGTALLGQALDLIASGRAPRIAQDEIQATYAATLTKSCGHIAWDEPAGEVVNRIRACWGWPGAFCEVGGRGLKIIEASVATDYRNAEGIPGTIEEIGSNGTILVTAGSGAVRLATVQPEGKRAMRAADYLRGARKGVGDRLSDCG